MREEHLENVISQMVSMQPKVRTGWNAVVVTFKDKAIVDCILRGKGKMRHGWRAPTSR